MAWILPQHSRAAVDRAGRNIVDPRCSERDRLESEVVVNNWRSSHSFPLNTIQNGLRKRAQAVDKRFVVAQRIKRLESIQQKLIRFPSTRLSQLQDLGGCRAIVTDVRGVDALVRSYKTTKAQHELIRLDDYISSPQTSGYRGVHMVFKYRSERSHSYDGLRIEMQIRSNMQHAWATAVETTGTFLSQGLKSSEGEVEWLKFFSLMGSAIAYKEERPFVPHAPSTYKELVGVVRELEKKLGVRQKLRAFGATISAVENERIPDAKYFLLELNPKEDQVKITGYPARLLDEATRAYLAAEKSAKKTPGAAAVLVAAGSLSNLKRAYPNYFLDTDLFLDALGAVLAL